MDFADDNVFVEHTVEQGSMVAGQPIESNIDDIDDIENQESDVVTPSAELIVKAEIQEAVLESHPTHLSDNSDIISENSNLEETELQAGQKVKKPVEAKYTDTLSPTDVPLKSIHSRENSASSLLEETLESAKMIASIYSVEGPTRSPDGEDSFYTASEMRRHSLAKRAVRSRPKLDLSTFSPPQDGDQSLTEVSQGGPAVQSNGDNDSAGDRSIGSLSSNGSRPESEVRSPKLEALEEQKVFICAVYVLFKMKSTFYQINQVTLLLQFWIPLMIASYVLSCHIESNPKRFLLIC